MKLEHERQIMKRNLIIVALVAAILSLGGCAPFAKPAPDTPEAAAIRDVRNAMISYVAAVTMFDGLVAAGKITDPKVIDSLETIRARAWDHLVAAMKSAEAGVPIDSATKLELFMGDLNALNEILLSVTK